MTQRVEWFTRKFSFDLPVWMYPNVLERLRGTPARLYDRIGSLPSEILTRRDEDKWSMQENAGHLLDLEPLGLGRLDDFLDKKESLRVADHENRKTHAADHNSKSIQEILAAFRAQRSELVRRMESFDEAFIVRSAYFPRLNTQMRVLDLGFFIAEHDDHHLARITSLIRMFGRQEG